jgi:hypothetical protein
VHDNKVLDRIKELYPIMYGKSTMPKSKLLRKEFAKGIVAKVVKGKQLIGLVLAMKLTLINGGNGY